MAAAEIIRWSTYLNNWPRLMLDREYHVIPEFIALHLRCVHFVSETRTVWKRGVKISTGLLTDNVVIPGGGAHR